MGFDRVTLPDVRIGGGVGLGRAGGGIVIAQTEFEVGKGGILYLT